MCISGSPAIGKGFLDRIGYGICSRIELCLTAKLLWHRLADHLLLSALQSLDSFPLAQKRKSLSRR